MSSILGTFVLTFLFKNPSPFSDEGNGVFLMNCLLSSAWEITTGIFGIVGTVWAIASAVVLAVWRNSQAKINEKNIHFDINVDNAGYYEPPYPRKLAKAILVCTNNSTSVENIIKVELEFNGKLLYLSNPKQNANITVVPQSSRIIPAKFVIPSFIELSNGTGQLKVYTKN